MATTATVVPVTQEDLDGTIDITSANVQLGDIVNFPRGYDQLHPVTVAWTQDTKWNKSGVLSHPRSASYHTFTAFNMASGRQREVQVFFAAEYVNPNFNWHPDHLSQKDGSGLLEAGASEVKKADADKPCLKIDKTWQYGVLGSNDIFLVYHPKSRKMYSRRFTNAAAARPAMFDGLLTGAPAVAGAKVAKGWLDAIYTVASINAIQSSLSAAVSGGTKVAENALSQYLRDF